MFESFHDIDPRYGGLNPAFAERVWAKRRAAKTEIAVMPEAEPEREPVAEPVQFVRRQTVFEVAAKWREERQKDVAKVLEKYRVIESPGRPSARGIIQRVALRHSIAYRDIVGVSRQKAVVAARFEAVAAVKEHRPDLSTLAIGKLFNRDHTTIIHALRKQAAVAFQHGREG